MRTLLTLFTLLTLTACVSQRERFAAKCNGYGFQPGTESFAFCMQREDERQQAQWAAAAQMLNQINQQQQQQELQRQQLYQQRQPVNCTTTRYGSTSSTQCY